MTEEELKFYDATLHRLMCALFNITADGYFKIEDLKDWLYAIALNNENYTDCITDIIYRLPEFIQYTKDKREA